MPGLPQIEDGLTRYVPRIIEAPDLGRAAVAMVLRDAAAGPEVLFIERATKAGDPWSGHMAFPGGRLEEVDADERAAAERETWEEVGLVLDDARLLGRLDDLQGRREGRPAGLVISAWVYHHAQPGPLVPNGDEVASTHWFPVSELHAPDRHVDFEHPAVAGHRFPGVLVGEPERHVVWGLTYRFLEVFFEAVARPLPERSWEGAQSSADAAERG